MNVNRNLQIGYLMQNGAPELSATSGPQLHTTAVITGLQKRGNQVRTVAIQKPGLGWSDDLQTWHPPQWGITGRKSYRILESATRRVQAELHLPFISMFDSLRYADACYHLLQGYDILFERHGYLGYGGILAARRLGIPIIIELNGNIVKEIDEMGVQMSPIQRVLGKWITYHTLRAANHIVVVAEALKPIVMAHSKIPAEKISVVLNGTDVELFAQAFSPNNVRAQYQMNHGPTVAFVGAFLPWHGVDLLITSFGQVQARLPQAQLVLIGDGPERSAAIAQIEAMGLQNNVNLLGRLPQIEVAALLSVVDVAVAPYPFLHADIIGTPLKLIEYMAAGKAIVASTAPIHEIITDGVTGLRVAPANPAALADGIVRLLGDDALRTTLGQHARQQAQQFSWSHVVEKLNQIFVTEIGRGNPKSSPLPLASAR
jgi:glycosyltransferase involved in cell wall biosynthesis